MGMSEAQAMRAAKEFQDAGYLVRAQPSPLRDWELVGEPVKGGKPLFAFSSRDMKLLIQGGRIRGLSNCEPW